MRHEVGHAVHSQLDQAKQNLVSNWLKEQFGWQTFGLGDSEIDAWVNLMGGYGNITEEQQQEVRKYLRDSSKQQPQPPNVPSDHPWNASNFGPRLALEQTGDPLWDNYHKWYRANGLAFYRDYDYGLVTAVNESTFDLVEQMPSSYALRSATEFFAELYALFYDLDDSRWGNIPQNSRDWLWENIGSAMPITERHYIIRNKQSRQVIAIGQARQENGADAIQWSELDGNDEQQWLLEDLGNGYYTLTAKHSGKALNVRGASTQDGTQIEQYDKNGTDAQQWELEETEDGYYILLSKASGMALTVSGNEANNGSPIQQQTNQESDIQKWRFEQIISPIPIPGKYYILRNKKNRLVINVSQNSKENGADVIQWTDKQSDNEQWLLEDIGNGYYTLTAKHSGKALNVRGASTQDGTPIEQYDKNGTDAQQWKLEKAEDGYYILLSKASGMALTGSGSNAQRGSLIQQHPNEKNDIQLWRFEQIYI